MDFLPVFLTGFGVILIAITLLWLISLAIKDSSIVDIFWGLGFVIVALTYATQTGGDSGRRRLVDDFQPVIYDLSVTKSFRRGDVGDQPETA